MRPSEQQLVLNFEKLGAEGISLSLLEAFNSPSKQHIPFIEILLEAIHVELEKRRSSRADRLLKRAKLHNTIAHLNEIEYRPERNLDRILIERLSTCDYIAAHSNVIIVGAAGTGKTFISRALARHACEHGYRTKVISFSPLLRELARLNKTDTLKYEKRMLYYSRFPLLLIDEWLCQQPDKIWVNILLELMELRYDSTSTIMCTQLPPENWPTVLGNVALGQAILGRIQAASFPIYLDGPDLRVRHSRKP